MLEERERAQMRLRWPLPRRQAKQEEAAPEKPFTVQGKYHNYRSTWFHDGRTPGAISPRVILCLDLSYAVSAAVRPFGT